LEFKEIQQLISKIDAILNVKILEENGEIAELHILANKLRAPKQIVRDIESSLLAAFNYRIDRKVISIAQIETDEAKTMNRVKYDGIFVGSSGTMAECVVKLLYEDEEYETKLSGIRTAANSRKIVAEATVRTVEKILGQPYIFDIQDVLVTLNGPVTFVSVLVNMICGAHEETMVGSVIVKNDINEAIVKATLDAINRRVQKNN
jgi:hypothetical protein